MNSEGSKKYETTEIGRICMVYDPIAQVLSFPLSLTGPWRFLAAVFLAVLLALSAPICTAANNLQRANSLFNSGNESYRMGDMPGAQRGWSQALAVYQMIEGTERQQATCHQNIGVALVYMGKYEEAIAKQEQAFGIFKAIKGAKREQADCYRNIGIALGNMGKHNENIAKQEQALSIYKTIQGTERQQATCHMIIGMALGKIGKYEEKIFKTEQALLIFKKIQGTEREQATCYRNIGEALIRMDKYEDGIVKQVQAFSIYRTIQGTEEEQATCYKNIGAALDYLGRYEVCIAKQEQALSIYKTIQGTEPDQADCYVIIGAALKDMGRYEECIAKQEQALSIYRRIKGTEREQANCYLNIGVVLSAIGKYKEAIAKQEQALSNYKTIQGTEWEQANCYQNIGEVLLAIGKYEEAVARHEQALAIFKTIKGTEREQASCYGDIGFVFRRIAKYRDAIAKYGQALSIFRTIEGTEREQRICYGGIGLANLGAGQYSKAITSFGQAGGAWWISQGFGRAYRFRSELGDDQKAIQSLLEAVRLVERKRASVLAFEHRTGIFDEPAQVFPDFVSLLADLSENKAKIEQSEVLMWSVDPKSDAALLEAAFHFADRGKGRAMEDALREKATLKATRPDINLLTKDKELSLQISKVTSMRDKLSQTKIGQRERLIQRINELQHQRNMIEVELKHTALGGYVAPEFRKPMDMAKELPQGTAVLQYSVGEKESYLLVLTRDGVTAHRIGVETPVLPELLPRQEATLGQLIQAWKERPKKIGLDGLVRLARMRAEDLSRKSRERHNLIDANQERAILERLGEVALPSSALAELREKEIRHLVVIPDGSLHYVPFAMLRVEDNSKASKQYLVEQYSISYTPAMTTLETIRKQAEEREKNRNLQRRSLLAFANPDFREGIPPSADDDMITRVRSFRSGYYRESGLRLTVLPETEQEAVRAGSLFAPPKVYKSPISEVPEGQAVVCVSGAASEEQVKRLLGSSSKARWQYLLFSTHGLADTHNGMLSCIALSSPLSDSIEDGFLQAQEVMDLELDADLVMLSACQTGLGRMRGGEGLVGLSSAFFYAGAESVCASLWQVPTTQTRQLGPTGQLVTEFFKNLKEGKLDRAEALRQAQLTVMRQGGYPEDRSISYSDPFCWAAFVLTGEWM